MAAILWIDELNVHAATAPNTPERRVSSDRGAERRLLNGVIPLADRGDHRDKSDHQDCQEHSVPG